MKLQKTISSLLCICLLLSLCACATPAEQQPTYAVGVSLKTAGISIVPDNGGTPEESIRSIAETAGQGKIRASINIYDYPSLEKEEPFFVGGLFNFSDHYNFYDRIVSGSGTASMISLSCEGIDNFMRDTDDGTISLSGGIIDMIKLGTYQAYSKAALQAGEVIALQFSCQACFTADQIDAYNSRQADESEKLSPPLRTHSHEGYDLLLTADNIQESPIFIAETEDYFIIDLLYMPKLQDYLIGSFPNSEILGYNTDYYERYVWEALRFNLNEISELGKPDHYACLYTAIEARKFLQNGCSFVQQ